MLTTLALFAGTVLFQEPQPPGGEWGQPQPMQDPRERMEQLINELRVKMESAENEDVRLALQETIRALEEEFQHMGPPPGEGQGREGPWGPGGEGPRGPEGRGGPDGRGGPMGPIPPELEERIREFYGEAVTADLDWLKENSGEDAYRKSLAELGFGMRELAMLKEKAPEEFDRQLEMRAGDIHARVLGTQIRDAHAGTERDRLAAELRTLLGTLFDAREEQRRREVEEMRRRIEEVEASLTNRQANRQSIIDRKFAEMTAREGELDW